ncbi:MAG: glycosyltransferase family 39 protein [Acidobacteriota bacterium]|nr:glycosyltransferase family 39 protein [Acidobacteriota bacterium]
MATTCLQWLSFGLTPSSLLRSGHYSAIVIATSMRPSAICRRIIATDTGVLALSAMALVALHTATNGQYGFHRDELATIDDARFLSWGYVVYPPITPFLARVSMAHFAASMIGLRLFAALAVGIAMVLTGLMAREIGGRRPAQLVAAWAAAIAGPVVSFGYLFQYVSFDYLCWVLAAWVTIRLLKSGDQRWWLALGAVVGLGMMTKFTMAFLLAGIVGGIFLTRPRWLLNKWLWCGAALAFLIFLPNFIWQLRHSFITLDSLRFIHARDVRLGRADAFLLAQFWAVTNPVTVPIWIAGLYFLFFKPEGKRYRMLGWMYLIPLLVLLFARGRPYYLAPAYPMLLAVGAVWGEQWLESLSPATAVTIRRVTRRSMVVSGLAIAVLVLPLAPPGSRWWKIADATNQNLNEEFGWREMTDAVIRARDSLQADDATVGVLAGDAGEAGAINLYGRGHGLPEVISGSNSDWLRGYGNPPPKTVIAAGFLRADLETVFAPVSWPATLRFPTGSRTTASGITRTFLCAGTQMSRGICSGSDFTRLGRP